MTSSKLSLSNATSWVEQELNGYAGVAGKNLPPYRVVRGQSKFFNPYNGWCPIFTENGSTGDLLKTAYLFQSAGVLEQLVRENKNGALHLAHSPSLNNQVSDQIGFLVQSGIFLERTEIWGVVERVRNLVLDWSLELEKAGILGDGMSFTVNEKMRATSMTNNYFAQNIGVAGNVGEHSTINSSQESTASVPDLAAIRQLVNQLSGLISSLPKEFQPEVEAKLQSTKVEIDKPAPDTARLHGWLLSLQNMCEGATGNLVASGAVEAIKAILR